MLPHHHILTIALSIRRPRCNCPLFSIWQCSAKTFNFAAFISTWAFLLSVYIFSTIYVSVITSVFRFAVLLMIYVILRCINKNNIHHCRLRRHGMTAGLQCDRGLTPIGLNVSQSLHCWVSPKLSHGIEP